MKRLILPLSLLLIVSSVSGFSYELSVEDRTSSPGDPAVFNLSVTNEYDTQDRFRISSLQTPPAVQSWFNYDYSKTIPSGETRNFEVLVEHRENILQQNYAFVLNLRSFNRGERKTVENFFRVENPADIELTDVKTDSSTFNPGEEVNVDVEVTSTASNLLDNFTVSASLFNQTEIERDSVLGSGSTLGYSFSFQVPRDEAPGQKQLTLTVERNGNIEDQVNQTVDVSAIDSLEKTSEVNEMLLGRSETVTVENTGNVRSEAVVERSLPSYIEPLVATSPEPDSIESNGDIIYTWKKVLEPGKKTSFGYTVDYTPAAAFVFMLLIAVLGMRKLQGGLKVSKNAKDSEEGIEVFLEVKNDTGRVIKNLEVKDFVPDIAKVDREFDMTKPVQTKTSNGTRLKWEIDRLEPGEERLMKYMIHPVVEVEGGVVLPEAEVMKEDKRETKSSEVEVKFSPE